MGRMSGFSSTRLGDVEDALVALFGTISDTDVVDGPGPRTLTQQDVVEVGTSATTVNNQAAKGLGVAYIETISIPCRAWSWDGGAELKPRRDRAIELLETARTMLAADVTVGGVCDEAWIGPTWAGIPINDEQGVSYQIGFTVQVKSNIVPVAA